MSGSHNSETHTIMNAHENGVNNKPEALILTQKEVDEQIRNCIAPLTKQLEDLTRPIQGMSTAHRPSLSPRAGTTALFSATGTLHDTRSA